MKYLPKQGQLIVLLATEKEVVVVDLLAVQFSTRAIHEECSAAREFLFYDDYKDTWELSP